MKTVSAVDVARKYLEYNIVNGTFLPGQKIKEEEVSRHLDISRPPIREAFKILEGEGLVEGKPNKGVFVSKITEKDIWEVYSLKEALYDLAVTLALDVVTDKNIQKLEKLVQEMETCLESKHAKVISKYQTLNSRFHHWFVEVADHQRLKNILSNLDIQIKRISYRAFSDKSHMRLSYDHHKAILTAIQRGDKEMAKGLLVKHARETSTIHRRLAKEDNE